MTAIESCGRESEPHVCASELEHDLDRALVDVQERDEEIARLRAELATAQAHAHDVERDRDERLAAAVLGELHSRDLLGQALELHVALDNEHTILVERLLADADEHEQSLRWSEALHEDVEARLRTQLANYEANHGARCDAEQERYATIAESACRMLASVRERLQEAGWWTPTGWMVWSEIGTFLSLPSHEVPGLRAQVAARDRALDACAARIADLLDDRDRLLGIAQRNGEDRDHWRAIARDESEGLHAELRTVRRYLATAERFVETFRGLTDVHLASIERIGSALCDREALLQHVRAEMLRLSEVGGATRMDLEMLALKVDVSRGGAEPGQDGGDSCAR